MGQQPEFSRYYQFPAMPIPPHWHKGRFAQWDERAANAQSATSEPAPADLPPVMGPMLEYLRSTPRIRCLLNQILGLPPA